MQQKTPLYVLRLFEGVTVIRFTSANLTVNHELERIRRDLEAAIDEGVRRLVLDFKIVRYINSAALGMMIALHHKMKGVGGNLVLSHPETIQDLLDVSRTSKLFPTAPDPKAAARMIKQI